MNETLAELNGAGDKIDVWFRYSDDNHRAIISLPNRRYRNQQQGGPKWEVPLTLDDARLLNEAFGPALVIGRALKVWGKEAIKRSENMATMAVNDALEPKELDMFKKIPKLAEWMRPYQRADAKFLSATSALNLNEQRLGKTPETIAAIFEAGLEHGPHLVCAPKSALNTVWRFEIERWTVDLPKPHEVITYSGEMSKQEREAAVDEFYECLDEEWPVWFVCTYDTVRAGNEPFLDPEAYPDGWATFTIDEFHRSGLTNASAKKGTGSKFADAVREITAQRRYGLSGTPMGGKTIKLWGGLHFLYQQQFTSKWRWAETWLDLDGYNAGKVKYGREDAFYASIAPYVVRRLRSEVLPQLPPAQWIDVWCEMTPKQAEQYRQFAARAEVEIEEKQLTAIGILAEYTRLKVFADAYCETIREDTKPCQACDGTGKIFSSMNNSIEVCLSCLGAGNRTSLHPIPSFDSGKLAALLDRLEEQGISGKKEDQEGESLAIVSSQFRLVADMIADFLESKGIKCAKITGATPEEQRNEAQMMFRQDGGRSADDPRVIVMTTTAGGVAITLDLVENVHIFDETWVPDDQEQLADRAVNTSRLHQIGVYVYRSLGTVEQHIMDTNVDKRDINKKILDLRRQGFRANMQAKVAANVRG
jgi:SNF2 family DNA or RNA helicase